MFFPWESEKKTQFGGSGVLWGGRTHRAKNQHIPAPHLEANQQLLRGRSPLPHLFLHPPPCRRLSQGFSKAVCEVSKGQLKFSPFPPAFSSGSLNYECIHSGQTLTIARGAELSLCAGEVQPCLYLTTNPILSHLSKLNYLPGAKLVKNS